jgi:peptidoglycan/xylan/chitin deacetylase (PgdA/CDA1 family)
LVTGKILYGLFRFPHTKNDLLVLNYHSTPEWLMPEFEKQLQFFTKHFHFVTPGFLNQYYNGKPATEFQDEKPGLLFTFDDGLKNNLHAAGMLEKYHTRGLFFLVPEFLKTEVSLQKNYYMNNIRNIVNFNIDSQQDDVNALSVSDIQKLIAAGHAIGSHSLTHTMQNSDDATKMVNEIVQSKNELESAFGVTVTSFCAPFDSLQSTSKKQMDLIREHYRFYHATFPGSNFEDRDPYFIKRVNVECWWPLDVIKFALSNLEWKRWRSRRQKFDREVLKAQ